MIQPPNTSCDQFGVLVAKASEAIGRHKIVQVHGTTAAHPKVRLATGANAAKFNGLMLVAVSGAASGKFVHVTPWIVLKDVDTSGATANDPVYLDEDGDWTLSPSGTLPRIVGRVGEISATVGTVLLAPGLPDPAVLGNFIVPGFTKGYGGVPLVFEATIPNTAGDVTLPALAAAGRVIDITVIKKTATGSTTDGITVKDGDGNTIATFAFDSLPADSVLRAETISLTHGVLAAAEVVTITATKTTNCEALVYITLRPSATAPG